jgi:hypothetical protein
MPELRNQIYDYLIEDIDSNVGPKTIRLRPRTDFSKYWGTKNPHRGSHYSLNQVCRATRREFGPLYVWQVAHRVLVDEDMLARFLQSFYLGGMAKDSFALTPKKIEIEIAYTLAGNRRCLDVMPLVNICLSNPDLQCTFMTKFGPMPELDNLFWNHAKAWEAAIRDDLLKIMLYPELGAKTIVELVFREDIKLDFIGDVPTKRWRHALPSMHEYLTELGAIDISNGETRFGIGDAQTRVEFVVSKRSCERSSQKWKAKGKAFETQYRLVEN